MSAPLAAFLSEGLVATSAGASGVICKDSRAPRRWAIPARVMVVCSAKFSRELNLVQVSSGQRIEFLFHPSSDRLKDGRNFCDGYSSVERAKRKTGEVRLKASS